MTDMHLSRKLVASTLALPLALAGPVVLSAGPADAGPGASAGRAGHCVRVHKLEVPKAEVHLLEGMHHEVFNEVERGRVFAQVAAFARQTVLG